MTAEHESFLGFMHLAISAKRDYAAALAKLAALDAACTRTTPNWSADSGHGGDSQRLWAMRADESVRVADAKAAVEQAMREVDNLIGQIDGRLGRRVLRLRYVHGWAWPRICATVQRSDRQIYRVHRQAMAEAEEVWRARQ